jgi:hypothetical protein
MTVGAMQSRAENETTATKGGRIIRPEPGKVSVGALILPKALGLVKREHRFSQRWRLA